ncbi:GNAT family N-acetyltransferase [Gymnodinialimonas sp.]
MWLASEAEKADVSEAYAAYMAELVPQETRQTPDPYFDLYWQAPRDRFPYLFGDAGPLGFAFVRGLDEPDLDFEIAEFCVYPVARRRGVGTRILPALLSAHPGRWEVSVLMTNAAGLAFWPSALRGAGVQNLRICEDEISRDFRFTVA